MTQFLEIGSFAETKAGGTPSTKIKEYWNNGEIPWINSGALNQGIIKNCSKYITQIGLDNSSAKLMPADTVLIALTGATTGITGYLTFESSANQSVVGVLPSKKHYPKYLYYYFISIRDRVLNDANGAAQPGINQKYVKKIIVPLPTIEKQKQIVAKLDDAFAAIDTAKLNVEKNLENAKELFQSKLNEVFTQKSEGWVEKKLGEVCSLIKRGIAPKYVEMGGIQVINQKCIRNHKIDLSLPRRHNIDLKSVHPEKMIRMGDVLVNSTGVGTLGRVAQVREVVLNNITVDTHVTIVRPITGEFFNDFFGYALIKIEDEITSSGEGVSGQTELARTKLENNFKLCYPASLEIQEQIVKVLDNLNEQTRSLESKYKQELESLEELKKSILEKAFNGEL
jgi:type I restriction enzyme, S subunit